jgi:phosphopantothenoylcysteine decarboxylase/phosphopantothenate--cysteine ligase
MPQLANRQVLLGITGGIAAYKSAELVRRLRDAGATVRVVMTPAACEFITPLTLQALSGEPVHLDLLDPAAEAAMGHIELARWADLVLVAPASADFMARVAAGIADDLLSTLCLATKAPLLFAPAMNQAMWSNAATQQNLHTLTARGVRFAGPGEGAQACGDTGPGRMLEVPDLVSAAIGVFASGPLAGVRLMLTAGPTREAIDPVRYISNSSSGKMGFALAAAAADAGAEVTLVAGPVSLPTPAGVSRIDVITAGEMHAAVMARVADCDVFIGCAAVADYRAAEIAPQKIKKTGETLELHLVRNPDIIAAVAAHRPRPFTVGFAAETSDLLVHARQKLERKGLDLVIANDVSRSDIGFGSDRNEVRVVSASGDGEPQSGSKQAVARALVEDIAHRLHATRAQTSGALPAC